MRLSYACLLAMSVLASTTVASAEDKKSNDPSGTWRWEFDAQGTLIESRLKLDRNGKTLSGTYDDQNVDADIENGKFDDGNITFDFTVDLEGNEITVSFSGQAEEDAITGQVDIGEFGEFPWEAKRATEPRDAAGDWELEIVTPDGQTLTPTVKLQYRNKELSGLYDSPLVGELPLSDVSLKDNMLKFTVRADLGGQEVVLDFSGKPRGSSLKGEVEYDFAGQTGTVEFDAVREKPKKKKEENKKDEEQKEEKKA